MKVTIEADQGDLKKLEAAGLLGKLVVLHRAAPARRRLSSHNQQVLEAHLKELRAYKARHGTFDVPRSGQTAALGDWLDKLRETYVKAPDGYRIRFLHEHAPDLAEHLRLWHATRGPRIAVRNAPFWLSAAWAMERMAEDLAAPSQASIQPDEVACARWLSRWTSARALEQLAAEPLAHDVAREMDAIVRCLRSRDPDVRHRACLDRLLPWRGGPIYQALAALCENDDAWVTPQRRSRFEALVAQRSAFWPSRSQWNAQVARWSVRQEPSSTDR